MLNPTLTNSFQFKKTIRPKSFTKKERAYFDYIISGHSLLDLLEINNSNLVTPFGWFENKEYEQRLKQILTLQQKPDLDTGRVTLYVCPECGDIDCGAITATVVDAGDQIQWKDFGFGKN